jgi:Domain of unknown function (DUF4389)
MEPSAVSYPLTFTLEPPEEIARWRPFVAWLLVFPHMVVLYVLQMVANVCSLIAWFAIVFTGKMPEGLAGLIAMFIRYQTRAFTYLLFLREEYPPFSFETTNADPGDDPRVHVDAVPELSGRNRVTVFFRWLWLIPSAIAFALIAIGASIAAFIAAFAVLFTGRWPEGLRTFVLGYLRWSVRLSGYAMLLTDDYPPFSLE